MSTKVFPSIMIAISLGAAVVYLISKDYKKVAYWVAAAVITFTVTF